MPNRGFLCTVLLSFAAIAPAWGQDLPKASRPLAPIAEVTVYSNGARITRTLAINAAAGGATVTVAGLTPQLDPDSIRIAEAPDWLRIASVESRPVFAMEAYQEEVRLLEETIAGLEDEKAALNDRKRAADRQLALIEALIAETPKAGSENVPPRPAEDWGRMIALVGEGAAEAYAEQRAVAQGLRDVDAALQKAQNELGQLRGSQRQTYTVDIVYESAQEGAATLALSYRTAGARWRPLYDARLDTEEAVLTLVQLAEVTQTTGEPWDGVALTLSTARPDYRGGVPELDTWFLEYVRVAEMRRGSEQFRDEADLAKSIPAAPMPAKEETAQGQSVDVIASEFAAAYKVPGRATVPPDGSAQKVMLTESSYGVALSVKAAPKVKPQAFLVGEIEYDGEVPLLPGIVSVYRDGAYVGRQSTGMIRPDETKELSFGIDDRVAIEYRLAEGERADAGLLTRRKRDRRLYKIDVANNHARPIEITVFDQLPVAREEDIDVEVLNAITEPTERDFDDRKGVLAWRYTYEPGEERTIEFGYEVSYPADQRIPGF